MNASKDKDGVVIDLVVQPKSSRTRVGPWQGDRLRVAVTAPAVDGKANAAVIATLADAFDIPKSAVTLLRGETGRKKTVRLEGVDRAALERVVASCGKE